VNESKFLLLTLNIHPTLLGSFKKVKARKVETDF